MAAARARASEAVRLDMPDTVGRVGLVHVTEQPSDSGLAVDRKCVGVDLEAGHLVMRVGPEVDGVTRCGAAANLGHPYMVNSARFAGT